MSAIELRGIEKRFGNVEVLQSLDLTIAPGELLVLLGPSGSGKTTLLRCIAGLESPDAGEVYLGDSCVFSLRSQVDWPARDREIGMVFQQFALYPHMTVFENVAFGLRVRKMEKRAIAARVREALEMVDLVGFERRKPKHLSGGQQQRVALARTVAQRPRFLLFDEPLSALDPKLRGSLRDSLRAPHKHLGTTSLYVTHDQHEAMILGDRIAVLQDGAIAQCAEPQRVYRIPETAKVAEFTANPKTNLIRGEVHDAGDRVLLIPERDNYCFLRLDERCRALTGRRVTLHSRPEATDLDMRPGEDDGTLEVLAVMPEGSETFVHLRFAEDMDQDAQVVVRGRDSKLLKLSRGQKVGLRFRRANLFDANSGALLGSLGYYESELGLLHPQAAGALPL